MNRRRSADPIPWESVDPDRPRVLMAYSVGQGLWNVVIRGTASGTARSTSSDVTGPWKLTRSGGSGVDSEST